LVHLPRPHGRDLNLPILGNTILRRGQVPASRQKIHPSIVYSSRDATKTWALRRRSKFPTQPEIRNESRTFIFFSIILPLSFSLLIPNAPGFFFFFSNVSRKDKTAGCYDHLPVHKLECLRPHGRWLFSFLRAILCQTRLATSDTSEHQIKHRFFSIFDFFRCVCRSLLSMVA
jgi:hypothetical protein